MKKLDTDPKILESHIRKYLSKSKIKIDLSKPWKDIPGIEGNFQIHYLGVKIRRKNDRKKYLGGRWNNNYYYTNIKLKDLKTGELKYWNFAVLQAMALGIYEEGKDVHHINKIEYFNYAENIMVLTREEHAQLHAKERELEKLNIQKVEMIPATDKQYSFISEKLIELQGLIDNKELNIKGASILIKILLRILKK
jgi:hypothetical protein